MRGTAALVRYRTAEKSRKASDEFVELLRNAKKDLKQCITIDPTELGAYCNLALTWDELGDRREAIRLSEEALAKLPSYPRIGLEKFLPDVSVNFACYLADDYRQTSDRDNQTELRFRIAKVCTDCRDYLRDTLKSSTAKVRFKTAMQRELAEGGDFRELPPETRTALEELIVAEKPSQDKLGHG
jgi:tetratricopeptide (TPR) repeat protein